MNATQFGLLCAGLVLLVLAALAFAVHRHDRRVAAASEKWEREHGPLSPRGRFYEPDDAVRVPVTAGFDKTKVVGQLVLQRSALPPTSDFCFALGYRSRAQAGDCVFEYELLEVSIVSDDKYFEFLQHHRTRRGEQ